MLKIHLCGDFLEVKEIIWGYQKTKTTYWYYDVKLWLRSIKGERNEIPKYQMTPDEISWVKKYYLPKAKVHTPILERSD